MKIKEIKSFYSKDKEISDYTNHFFLHFLYRPISFYLTWIFLKINFSANQVTILSFFFGPLLFLSNYINYQYQLLISFSITYMFFVFDCVDGNIARIKNQSSKKGEYLDSLSGTLFSIIAYCYVANLAENSKEVYLIMALVSNLLLIITRYYNLRFGENKKGKALEKKLSLINIVKSVPNLLPFFVIIAHLGNAKAIIILLTGYHLSAMIYILFKNYKSL